MSVGVTGMEKHSFNTFVVGSSNRIAYEAAKKVAQRPGKAINPLCICGETGLGATHLMQAIGHAVMKRNRDAKIAFIPSEKFAAGLVHACQHRRLAEFRKQYRGMDVLLLDDVQYFAGKESTQAELINIFNNLLAANKQIVLTSDLSAGDIPRVGQRLVSQSASGLVAILSAPDRKTRIAILREKRNTLKVQIPDDVLKHIAGHIHSNIRSMEGALIRAAAYSSLTGRQLTLTNVAHLLRDHVAD